MPVKYNLPPKAQKVRDAAEAKREANRKKRAATAATKIQAAARRKNVLNEKKKMIAAKAQAKKIREERKAEAALRRRQNSRTPLDMTPEAAAEMRAFAARPRTRRPPQNMRGAHKGKRPTP
jgi:hypothetical protein